jgi:anti-anti-sigma factor
MGMQLTVAKDEGELIFVRSAGTIREEDVHVSTHPLEALLGPDAFRRRVLFNLELTPHIDSSGVGWLLGCHKRCLQSGGKLVLYSVPPMVLQILRVLRIDSLLLIAANEPEARALALEKSE